MLVRSATATNDVHQSLVNHPSHLWSHRLGGLVIEHLNKMPAVGDEVRYENVLLRIEKMQRRRISLIRMTILSEKADTVETVQE